MLELVTSCRLHFGLLELAADQPHRYGGLGLMVQDPEMRLVCDRGEHSWMGPAEVLTRIQQVILREAERTGYQLPNDCWLDVIQAGPMHSGLGIGTQLASAVATMLRLQADRSQHTISNEEAQSSDETHLCLDLVESWSETGTAMQVWQSRAGLRPEASNSSPIAELAQAAGRGKRSSIGLHGFLSGGLVRDLGQMPLASAGSPSLPRRYDTTHVEFPQTWPVVLLLSVESGDMYGETEDRLIASAGDQPNPHREPMLELSAACMTAAGSRNYEQFVVSLEQYMDRAAALFAPVQAGRYRTDLIRERVDAACRAGLRGCGQSSWGPTVFGFATGVQQAEDAAAALRHQFDNQAVKVIVTTAATEGARWRLISPRTKHAR